jgi:hypothetical protein
MRQQIRKSMQHTSLIKHVSYYYANKNMSTEYIYSQMSDKYNNTKFRQPKNKRLVRRQDRPPKFVTWKLDTQEGSQKTLTHPRLIINAAFFIHKNLYVPHKPKTWHECNSITEWDAWYMDLSYI